MSHDLVVRLDDAIDARERLQLLARVLPPDAAYSHLTAAALLGAHVDLQARAQVALSPRPVLPQRAEFVVHTRALTPEDVVDDHGLRVTSGPQTFLDLAAPHTCPRPSWSPSVTPSTGTGTCRRPRWPGGWREAAGARGGPCPCVPPLLVRTSMSRPESLIRCWLLDSDLPEPGTQGPVHDAHGREVAHGDLGYAQWRVLLEYEGQQHAEPDRFDSDIDRYSLMAADGWRLLRFAKRHLQPWTVVGRHPPGPPQPWVASVSPVIIGGWLRDTPTRAATRR